MGGDDSVEEAMEDWEDYARDDFINSLYEDFARDVLAGRDELYGEVINQFTLDRLQSYYLANPGVASRARWALDQATGFLAAHSEAALVFAAMAAEVVLKAGLLKPILHGLVHDESLALIIAELVPEQRNKAFQRLLFGILREYGGLDLGTFKRPGISKTLWDEMEFVQQRRNALIHRAEPVPQVDAQLAVDIARVLVHDLFGQVVRKLGLRRTGSSWCQGTRRTLAVSQPAFCSIESR